MELHNTLGVYLDKNSVAVSCVDHSHQVMATFGFSIDDGASLEEILQIISEKCQEQKITYGPISVAIGPSRYMQHNITSNFTDPKQIASTIGFDIEETIAASSDDLALCMLINSTGAFGSDLTVFTCEKSYLSSAISAFQRIKMDPISVEPDICSAARLIKASQTVKDLANSVFILTGRTNGYIIALAGEIGKPKKIVSVRNLTLNTSTNRTDFLKRQIPMTLAAIGNKIGQIDKYIVYDNTDSIDFSELSKSFDKPVDQLDSSAIIKRSTSKSTAVNQSSDDSIDDCFGIMIASGAAIYSIDKSHSTNFRLGYLPYQGRKRQLERLIKIAGIVATVVLLAVGSFFQSRLNQKQDYLSDIEQKFAKDYKAVMRGKSPPNRSNPVKNLTKTLNRLKALKSGKTTGFGQESIPDRLTKVLAAFNDCAEKTDLSIDTITLNSATITVTGSTSGRKQTLAMFKAIEKKMKISQQQYKSDGNSDRFSLKISSDK